MTKEEIEYAVLKNTVNTLCVLCANNSDNIIDILTGHLWDEEEADNIKRSDGKFYVFSQKEGR